MHFKKLFNTKQVWTPWLRLLNTFSRDIGIDLGTANTVVYVRNKGITLREPSVVAFDKHTNKVLAVGSVAHNMVGRTPGNIIAVRPMKSGVIADFEVTEMMIRTFIEKASRRNRFFKPRVIVAVPWGITNVEKRAVIEAASKAGARHTFLVEEPLVAAIGANLDVSEPRGHMIVDIGGGTTEVGVISLGGLVVCKSIRVAGDVMDEAIIQHARKHYNLLIGDKMAEKVKIDIGSAYPLDEEQDIEIRGRDLLSGLPRNFNLSSQEIRDTLSETISTIIDAIRITLEKTPPELASDIAKYGIYLTGGGSLLKGLDKLLQEETMLPVNCVEDPLSCVALGTGLVMEEIDTIQTINQPNTMVSQLLFSSL